MLKLVAPEVGGVEASDGTWYEADEKLDGGPSVLFDAVAILPSENGAALLATKPAARSLSPMPWRIISSLPMWRPACHSLKRRGPKSTKALFAWKSRRIARRSS
jgi:hypothetical protein